VNLEHRRPFAGHRRIGAGWGALLFGVLLVGLILGLRIALSAYLPRHAHLTPLTMLLRESALAAAVAGATAVMAFVEQRPVLSYGFVGERSVRRFVGGVAAGVVALSILVGALWGGGFLALVGQPLHGAGAWGYGAAWGGVFTLVAIAEEAMLRGYLQQTLARGIGFWWAALLLSALFGAAHGSNPGESPVGLVAAAAAGLVFCLGLRLTGSLFWSVGFHAGWDWAQSYLFGVPDSGLMIEGHLLAASHMGSPLWSGGTTGPEGSAMVFPLLGFVAIAMWLTWHRGGAAHRA
jgi:membrane protease YdiL (CAAX protease family)